MIYKVQSAVLLLNFNRPELSLQVFNAVKAVKPARLYFACDGPRSGNESDMIKCEQVKNLIGQIDWNCEIKKLIRETNLGCKTAVSSSIDWFFEQEEEGIILEDDCLPGPDFFYFCDSMLTHYRTDSRIFLITGTNFQMGIKRTSSSYYFSNYSNIWGWASWRRTWKMYDKDLSNVERSEVEYNLKNIFSDKFLIEAWINIFDRLKSGETDTWDYQLNFITFFQNGLCVTPNVNLVSNIGFRIEPTHYNANLHYAALALEEIELINHPKYVLPSKEADYYLMEKEFKLDEKWLKYKKDKLLRRRFKSWIRGLFS